MRVLKEVREITIANYVNAANNLNVALPMYVATNNNV